MDFYLFEHTDRDVVELIGYNTGIFLEFKHIFLIKSVLFSVAAKEMTFRMGEHRKVPSRALGGKYAAASAHGHDRGHSKHHSQAAPEEAAVKSSETSTMMDEIAGEYVFDHIVRHLM